MEGSIFKSYLVLIFLGLLGCHGCEGGLEHADKKEIITMNMINLFIVTY